MNRIRGSTVLVLNCDLTMAPPTTETFPSGFFVGSYEQLIYYMDDVLENTLHIFNVMCI